MWYIFLNSGNHYAQLKGAGNVTIVTSLETDCNRIQVGAKLGFLYKMTENTTVNILNYNQLSIYVESILIYST